MTVPIAAQRPTAAPLEIRALKPAVKAAVDYLVAEKRLTPADGLSLASIAVNFHVAEAVDGSQVVAGKIPKNICLNTAASSR